MKIRLTEQEKNRILNIHQTSKNVNGVLISEQEDYRVVYFVRVGFETRKALRAANTKDKGAYDFGSGQNLWWKASHPDTYMARDIKEWNAKYPERPKHIRISNGKAQKEFYWEMGPFSSKDKAIAAQKDWDEVTWDMGKLFKRCGSGNNWNNYKTISMDATWCGEEKEENEGKVYDIVLACMTAKNAKAYYDKLKKIGWAKLDLFYNQKSKCYFVTYGPFNNKSDAKKKLPVIHKKINKEAWIYTSAPRGATLKGDVATETDTENLKFPNLELSDTLTLNQMPTFDPTKEGIVYQCTSDETGEKVEGCAAYVRQELGEYQGNAWHAHRHNDPLVYSAFLTGMGKKKNEIEQLFNKINKNPGTLSDKGDSFDSAAKKIAQSLVPSQSRFSSLEIDDVVGLYYNPSTMHSTAFFGGMTGRDSNGTGSLVGDGPFMVRADGEGKWSPEMLGKDIDFKIGKTLTGGKGPGLNTHLGYVGAKNNGEPIIFHNIHGEVYATPLHTLSKDGTAIVWAKRGKGTSGEKVVLDSKVDGVKQTLKKAWNDGYNYIFGEDYRA